MLLVFSRSTSYQIGGDAFVVVEFEVVNDDASVPATREDVVAEASSVDQLLDEDQLRVRNGPLAQRRVYLTHDL